MRKYVPRRDFLIGMTMSGRPIIFQLAPRYWMSVLIMSSSNDVSRGR